MIKYKLKYNYGDSVLDTVLKNRGITLEEADRIISPKKTCMESPLSFKNIYRAIDALKLAIKEKKKIGVLVDNDCDGFTSASMIYDFISNVLNYNNIDYILHKNNKAHGLGNEDVMESIYSKKIELLIVPDAATNDIKEHIELINNNIEVLILDHHLQEVETIDDIIIINPHISDKIKNKNQSGCMVVYKFIRAFCDALNITLYPSYKYTDLVAVSLVADVCDMTELENRYLFNLGRQKQHLTNALLQEYFREIESDELLIDDIAFKVSPYVNAVIRLGEESERDMLFRAFANFSDVVPYKKRGIKDPIMQTLPVAMCRLSKTVKSRQDKKVKKSVENIVAFIEDNSLNNNKILFIDATNYTTPATNGLVANKIMSMYKKPVVLIRENENTVGGSGRGLTLCEEIPSFKELLEDTGLVNCIGHDNAFGVVDLNKDNINNIVLSIEDKLADTTLTTDAIVDYVYDKTVPVQDLLRITEFENLWCNHLKEPLFVIKNVKVNSDSIQRLGTSTYVFKVGKIGFAKYFGSKAWYNELVLQEKYPFGNVDLSLDILCSFKKNNKGFAYVDIKEVYSREDADFLGF